MSDKVSETLLKGLSRDELIKIIATMHDTIQDWDSGWGFDGDDSKVLIEVGRACAHECTVKQKTRKNAWSLDGIFHKLAHIEWQDRNIN